MYCICFCKIFAIICITAMQRPSSSVEVLEPRTPLPSSSPLSVPHAPGPRKACLTQARLSPICVGPKKKRKTIVQPRQLYASCYFILTYNTWCIMINILHMNDTMMKILLSDTIILRTTSRCHITLSMCVNKAGTDATTGESRSCRLVQIAKVKQESQINIEPRS